MAGIRDYRDEERQETTAEVHNNGSDRDGKRQRSDNTRMTPKSDGADNDNIVTKIQRARRQGWTTGRRKEEETARNDIEEEQEETEGRKEETR